MSQKHENWVRLLVTGAMAAALVGVPSTNVSAQSYSSSGTRIVLPRGTVFAVRLDSQLSSNKFDAGNTFTASVDDSTSAYRRILERATVAGVILEATPRSGETPGMLRLAFTRLYLWNGRSYAISGTPISLYSRFLRTRPDGVLAAYNSTMDEHLTYVGYGSHTGRLVSVSAGCSVLSGPEPAYNVALSSGTKIGVLLSEPVHYFNARAPQFLMAQHLGGKFYAYQGHQYYLNEYSGKRVLMH